MNGTETMEITREELEDLWYLCDREADQFDYDKEVYVRFTELAKKLDALIGAKKAAEGQTTEGGTK